MNIKLLVKDISWDVPEYFLGLEPLNDDAPLEDHIKRLYQEIPEKIKNKNGGTKNDSDVL